MKRIIYTSLVVKVAALAAAATMHYPAPAFADHRPGNVVVMGGTVSQTGRLVEAAGRQHNGVKLYVEELNARSGLLGHKIELKIYDDKSDKRTAVELYEKLITEDKVDLILGPYSSFINDAAANVMERYRLLPNPPFAPRKEFLTILKSASLQI